MVGSAAHGPVRHRPIDQALRGCPPAARRGSLSRGRQSPQPDVHGRRALAPRARSHPRHRHRRCPPGARGGGRVHRSRRRPRRPRHHEDDAEAYAPGRLPDVRPRPPRSRGGPCAPRGRSGGHGHHREPCPGRGRRGAGARGLRAAAGHHRHRPRGPAGQPRGVG